MKAVVIRENRFVPVNVTLTLESQDELDALFAIGNYGTFLRRQLKDGTPSQVTEAALSAVTGAIYTAIHQADGVEASVH